jgi:hypothetical protein
MQTKINTTMKCYLKNAGMLLCLAASALTVFADDSANLIKNPYFESIDGKIAGWGQKEKGTLESFNNPADSEQCGRITFTYATEDKAMAKSNIFQTIANLAPGDYILSFSCSGEDLKAIFTVVRFQKEPGFTNTDSVGKFEKYIGENKVPLKGEWKDFVFSFKVPEGSAAGTIIFEVFGVPEQTGYALIKNVRLVKQEE